MKPRRTFWVRVSSPSSASSSLCRIRKRLICAPAITWSSASERFTSSTCFCDHVVDQRMAGELLIGAVDDVVALGPVADRGEIDVDHHGDEVAPVAERHRLRMLGKNLSLFSMYFGANSVPSLSLPTSLARSMIFRWPVFGVEEAGVAGLHIAVRRHRLGGLGLVLEIADEHAGRLELHLAVVGDADVDVGAAGRPCRHRFRRPAAR